MPQVERSTTGAAPSHAVRGPFHAAPETSTPRRRNASALRVLPEMPLYARVDGVVREGVLIVIEVEVLEPALFMEFDPTAAERFAEATLRRL